MPSQSSTPRSPRNETDQSLRVERTKTDVEIEKREDVVRNRSDEVVDRARGRADELLADARGQADATLDRDRATPGQRKAIENERAVEDTAVQDERNEADRQLEEERAERVRALNALLRFERDQTDERLLLERASGDASLKARDDFMAMVAHDIRNLLGGIALTAAIQVKSSGSDDAGQRSVKAAEKIQRLTARINRLVGDLFDVTSIESGRFSVTPAVQDARALITEAIEAYGAAAAAKRITLETFAGPEPLNAAFDHDRVFQVLVNLLNNAIKFTPEGGRVSLRLEAAERQLHFSVSDTGPGIAAHDLETVFERFWQVQKGDRRGLGLGLFIGRRIAEAHHGRLWAESVEGKGSTFHFTLPAGGAPAPARG